MTFFNIRGVPKVYSAEDALRCLMDANLDILVIGNIFLLQQA
tara:strand:- start:4225 stop:4350 length:126 start_codon:yes stop_codon:yes gene_type:complete